MSVDDLSLCLGVLWVLWCCMLSSSKRPVTDHKLENNLLFHSFQAKMRCFPLFYFIPEYTQKNVELIFEILNPREPLSSKQYLLYLFRFRPSRNLGGPATLPLLWPLPVFSVSRLKNNPHYCGCALALAVSLPPWLTPCGSRPPHGLLAREPTHIPSRLPPGVSCHKSPS